MSVESIVRGWVVAMVWRMNARTPEGLAALTEALCNGWL